MWSKVATAADAGSIVTVKFPAQVKGSLALAAYSGTNPSDPVAAITGVTSHTTETSAATPPVTVPAAGGWLVSYWAAKSSSVTAWTAAPDVVRNSAIGTGGGQISSLLGDSNAILTAGSAGGLTATADEAFSAADTLSIVLTPTS